MQELQQAVVVGSRPSEIRSTGQTFAAAGFKNALHKPEKLGSGNLEQSRDNAVCVYVD